MEKYRISVFAFDDHEGSRISNNIFYCNRH